MYNILFYIVSIFIIVMVLNGIIWFGNVIQCYSSDTGVITGFPICQSPRFPGKICIYQTLN